MPGVVYVSAMPLMPTMVHSRVVVGGDWGCMVFVMSGRRRLVLMVNGRVVVFYLPAVRRLLHDFVLQLVWRCFVRLMVMMMMFHHFHFLV
jgi:hypothetical protein